MKLTPDINDITSFNKGVLEYKRPSLHNGLHSPILYHPGFFWTYFCKRYILSSQYLATPSPLRLDI